MKEERGASGGGAGKGHPVDEHGGPGKRTLVEGLSSPAAPLGVGKQTRVPEPAIAGQVASLEALLAELGFGAPLTGPEVALANEVGADPRAVRVHRGPEAARVAGRQQARAFTVGTHIVMGGDAPAAGTPEGDEVMRHELAHTAQQHAAAHDPAQRHGPIGAEQPAAERDADHVASASGRAAAATGLQVQRFPAGPRAAPRGLPEKVSAIRKALADGEEDWARRVVDLFEQTEPAARITLQRQLDMEALVRAMPDFEATRLGTLGPLIAGRQTLNRKRAAYIEQVINDFGDRAEIFVLFAFRGVYDDDAYDIFAALADHRYLHKLRAMPEVAKQIKARGLKLDGFGEPGVGVLGGVGGVLGGVGAGIRHFVKDDRPGEYRWQKDQLPDEYAGALSAMEMAELEGNLTVKNVIIGAVDEVTFGVPHGVVDLGRNTVGAVGDLARGEYRAAGEQLTGAAVVVLTHLGVKAWRVAKAAPDPGGLKGPKGGGQFVIPGFEGPISAEEARLGAIFELNPDAQAAMGRLIARVGRGGVERLADQVRASHRAALFVAEHGERGAYALLEAEGDVAAAETKLPSRQLPERASSPAPARVAQAGNRPELMSEINSKEKLDPKYTKDPRFDALAADPDHAGKATTNSLQEAAVGLEAEARGLLRGPIERGSKGIEFYDADGHPWDVKKPPSPVRDEWRFKVHRAFQSICEQVREQRPNKHTGVLEPIRVLLDSSFMTPVDHAALWAKLRAELSSAEQALIVELNTFP